MAIAQTKSGLRSDEDAPKKSLTDAIIKAASHLGIAANIFLGRWDVPPRPGAAGYARGGRPHRARGGDLVTSRLPAVAGTRRELNSRVAMVIASLFALAGFLWPLIATAVPKDAQAAVPVLALALVPVAVVALALTVDRQMHSATTVVLLGMLTAVGAAVRIAGTGVGGLEAVFIVLILAGRAFGARFGFLLGMLVISLSSVLWGGIGPWTPFQIFACGWVAAGAGHRVAQRGDLLIGQHCRLRPGTTGGRKQEKCKEHQ